MVDREQFFIATIAESYNTEIRIENKQVIFLSPTSQQQEIERFYEAFMRDSDYLYNNHE